MVAVATEASAPARVSARQRIASVDLLRGLIIVIMALDHVRDSFTNVPFEPTEIAHTNPALFFTRWITHFCAPVFVLLSGASAGLQSQAGKSKRDLAWFLLTRGLFLALLELTVVKWLFMFQLAPTFYFLQVIWVIGVSMMVLAGLIFLPRWAILTIALAMIFSHNLFDSFGGPAAAPTSALGGGPVTDPIAQLWMILHAPGMIQVGPAQVLVLYPLIPWIGVCALGYVLADVYRMEPQKRVRLLLQTGLAATGAFFLVRLLNIYGDPAPWSVEAEPVKTVLSFFNVTKYPPSLSFLLMTLGPALVVLALAERWKGPIVDFFVVYGRVPLFFYLVHWALVHAAAVLHGVATGFPVQDMLTLFVQYPEGYGTGLVGVYLVWGLVIAALYWPCAWWGELKRRTKSPLLSYL